MSEKGFDNHPFKKSSEKPNYKTYSLYNQEENNNDIKEEQEEKIPYQELIFFCTEFLKNSNIFFKKTYILNSVCNLISNIIRMVWLDLKNPGVLITKIVEDFLNDV